MAGTLTRGGVLTRALQRAGSIIVPSVRNYRTNPLHTPQGQATAAILRTRLRGKTNSMMYRAWSINGEFVRTAMDIRSGQLQRAEWDIVQFDREGKPIDRGLARAIREKLQSPSPKHSSFSEWVAEVAEDLFALDAGVIEKERTLRGEIAYLWPTDGAGIYVDRFWEGDVRQPRYWWMPQAGVQEGFLNDDMVYMKIHPRTNEPTGISYLETLKNAIDADLNGSMFNARQVMQAAPDGVMDLGETARPDQVDAFKSFFQTDIFGQGLMAFWGGTKGAKFIPFRQGNREMQFVEWLQYNAIKTAAVFQISVQDLQMLHDVNRANAEVQQENTEDRGVRTILGKVQDYLTGEVVWDPGWGGRGNNLCFRYLTVADHSSLQKAQEQKITLAGMPSESINSARKRRGDEPIGDPNDESNPYNKLMANTSQGLVTLDDIPTARELAMRPPAAAAGATASSGGTSGRRAASKSVAPVA